MSEDQPPQWSSLTEMFFAQAAWMPNRPFLWGRREHGFVPWTWRTAADAVRGLARGLVARGLRPGDRVVLVAENRPEWTITDLAVMAAGGITVPSYTTHTVETHRYIIDDCDARLVVAGHAGLARDLLQASANTRVLQVVAMAPPDPADGDPARVEAWQDVLNEGTELDTPLAEPDPDTTACLIYTSGTSGAPKGVMLGHGAILHNCRAAHGLLESTGLKEETFLSFLPLSHAYEHTVGQFFPIYVGAQLYFSGGFDSLRTDMATVQPTIMTAVPRLYEVMRDRMERNVGRRSHLRRFLFAMALTLGRRRYEGRLTFIERLPDRLLDRLVRDPVRARFGGRLKALVSGGAPLNPEVGLYFHALGLPILQGYGQTESGPVVSCNPPGGVRLHTVGRPLADVTVTTAADGEILVHGPNVMQGYWNKPEATAETVVDGWLHTGDVGHLDGDGYLVITDRKKDIIVLSGGENIAPQAIESRLTLEPPIGQAMVVGDHRPHLAALVVPDDDWLLAWAQTNDRGLPEHPSAEPDVVDAMETVVRQINDHLPAAERVRRFVVVDTPFTVENGLLTPTLKIRRHRIAEAYDGVIRGLYGEGGHAGDPTVRNVGSARNKGSA